MGVPMVGQAWGACDPANPRNRRLRPSILIERGDTAVLVDAGPDFRQQALSVNLRRLDGVILTHEHADHVHGIDDLRGFSLDRPMPLYGTDVTLGIVRNRFPYMFGGPEHVAYHPRPFLDAREVQPGQVIDTPGLAIGTFAQDHTVCISLGLRLGNFAYSTDLARIGDEELQALRGIDTWIVAALRREPHPAHATLAQVLEWIARVRPRRAILTHMNASMDYDALRRELPEGVEPGYDGMVIDLAD